MMTAYPRTKIEGGLEKGESSQAVRSYADVTREYLKTPLGQNRIIIS